VVFGGALLVAGLLVAHAARARDRDRVLTLAGVEALPVTRRGPRLAALAARADVRGWSVGPVSYAVALGAAALVAGVWGWILLGPVGAGLGALGAPALLERGLARRAERTRETMDGQLREAVVAMSSAVRSGRSVRGAVDEAIEEVDEPLRGHLRAVTARLEVGESIDAALGSLRDSGPEDARLLVTLLEVHGRTGGALPAMLDEVATIVGQRTDARRTLRALTAQGRASGAVLAVLPIAFVTLLSWTGGDGLGAFYRTPLGIGLLLAGLTCDALGFLWIRRILRPRWLG
jgi:tight adherence protein B